MKKIAFSLSLGLIVLLGIAMASCSKEPGTGGNSAIYGKVYVKDYNDTFTVLNKECYGKDIDVYLFYGDDRSYKERVRTSYDGNYEFKYLRAGDYHVYCYSEDSTLQTRALIPVIQDVTVSGNHKEVKTNDIIIFQ